MVSRLLSNLYYFTIGYIEHSLLYLVTNKYTTLTSINILQFKSLSCTVIILHQQGKGTGLKYGVHVYIHTLDIPKP